MRWAGSAGGAPHQAAGGGFRTPIMTGSRHRPVFVPIWRGDARGGPLTGTLRPPKKNQPPDAPPGAGERVPTSCLDEMGTAQGQITDAPGNCQLLRSYDLARIHEGLSVPRSGAAAEPWAHRAPTHVRLAGRR